MAIKGAGASKHIRKVSEEVRGRPCQCSGITVTDAGNGPSITKNVPFYFRTGSGQIHADFCGLFHTARWCTTPAFTLL